MIEQGDKSPGIKLPRNGGGAFDLADYKRSPVVLFFYPKDDTSGCTKEAIAFTGLKGAFDELGATSDHE